MENCNVKALEGKRHNAYDGFYKGNEDEYEISTMSPWIEDVMEQLKDVKSVNVKYLREGLIVAAYEQRKEKEAVANFLQEQINLSMHADVKSILEVAYQKELEFIK